MKEEDVVMCTVKSIEGTTVFLDIEGDGVGSMVMSEVAAGRIRNLREYVAPNKKIVCKVLRIDHDGHVHLSLRRVTGKEREVVQERYKKERTLMSMLKTACKDSGVCITQIKKSYELWDFYDKARENPAIIEKVMSKSEADNLKKLVAEKKDKEKLVKKVIILKSFSESGVKDIQEILSIPGMDIHYLGSSQFSISTAGKDFKQANIKIESAIQEIEKRAKDKKAHFELKEK